MLTQLHENMIALPNGAPQCLARHFRDLTGEAAAHGCHLPLVFWRFFILKIRLVVLTAVIDADDIHGVVRYLKQNCHTPTKPKRSQARSKIVAPRASVRKSLQLLAMVHDGIDIARRHGGRRCPGNIDFQLVELVASFRGEMNGVRHAEADRLRFSARC